jgi:DNA-binding SARP family transcriptional activator
VDAWVFDRRISEAEAAWESAADEADLQFASELTRKALLLYKGPLLQARDDRVIHLRDHLHNRFLWAVQKLGRYLQGRRKWEAAISIYEAGLKIDRLVEPFYRDLMICNHRLGRRSKAIAAYERCEKVLSENLRLQPAAETRALKRSLLK